VVASHLGRPKGKPDPKQSLKPVREALERYLRKPVAFAAPAVGPRPRPRPARSRTATCSSSKTCASIPARRRNDPAHAKALASLGDAYVDDAFGAAHRAHASTEGITAFITDCAAGFLLEQELKSLARLLESPERPYVAILGGAKISGKIDVLTNLLPRVDRIVIGGGMMFTFLKAKGIEVGRSLVEEDRVRDRAEPARRSRGYEEAPASRGRPRRVGHHRGRPGARRSGQCDSPRIRRAWTSVPRRSRRSRTRSRKRARSSGTAPWASSRSGLRGRDARRGPRGRAGHAARRLHRGGRRRLARRRAPGRRREQDQPPLDGRRRVARISRGEDTSRRRSARARCARGGPMSRILAANWKMNPRSRAGARALRVERRSARDLSGSHVPRFPAGHGARNAREARGKTGPALGGQSCHSEPKGPFTGEVSAEQLRDAGAEYVLVGHSERRRLFCESDAVARAKLGAAWRAGLTPLLCIGETLAERERQETQSVISRQLARALDGAPARATLLVAYEPVWAIGTGIVATTEQVAEAHGWVGEELTRLGRSATPGPLRRERGSEDGGPPGSAQGSGRLPGGRRVPGRLVVPRDCQGLSRGRRARPRLTPARVRGNLVGHTRPRTSRRSSCRAF
jgi:triosephosphate isomerase